MFVFLVSSIGRNKPLAPTCNICLIRDDLTTLWCEVTSSIRTRSVEDDSPEDQVSASGGKTCTKNGVTQPNTGSKSSKASAVSSDEAPAPTKQKRLTKEFLLCLRPIRDGEGKVDESLRFDPSNQNCYEETTIPVPASKATCVAKTVSNAGDPISLSGNGKLIQDDSPRKVPSKKRPLPLRTTASTTHSEPGDIGSSAKRIRIQDKPSSSSDTEKSVVESLMLMSNKST